MRLGTAPLTAMFLSPARRRERRIGPCAGHSRRQGDGDGDERRRCAPSRGDRGDIEPRAPRRQAIGHHVGEGDVRVPQPPPGQVPGDRDPRRLQDRHPGERRRLRRVGPDRRPDPARRHRRRASDGHRRGPDRRHQDLHHRREVRP